MDNLAMQEDELLVIESIYTSEEFVRSKRSNLNGGHFYVFHELPKKFKIIVKSYKKFDTDVRELPVSRVPPIDLDFTLPLSYPSESPPNFTIECPWLTPSMLTDLCRRLDELWLENRGFEILYIWFNFLKENVLQLFSVNNSVTIDDLMTVHFGEHSLINSLSNLQISGYCKNESSTAIITSSAETKPILNISLSDSTEPIIESSDIEQLNLKNNENCCNETADRSSTVCDNRVRVKNIDIPIHVSLLEYNRIKTSEDLKKSRFTCSACFSDKSGADCTQFTPCEHVFCKECISSYFEVKINEGQVFSIGCLESNCQSSASQSQIREHIPEQLFERYDKLLLSASLDVLSDIIYCPRKHCNYPVTREPNEKLAVCPECKFPFCVLCKMTYHGIESCKVSNGHKRALILEYQNADEKKKKELELRYGHRQLQTLLYDSLSVDWITDNSKSCPNCNAAIEKSDGCNKMACTKCGVFFCWICKKCLSQDRPYDHFSSRTSPCFNLLFEGAVVEELEDDLYIFPEDGEDEDDIYG